ncbi:hypothetical protein PISMIDRAFT_355855 [Pisolithus microcarpus 441]|uniref:Uncharacterized protein n=1 Tax=Pisolithus microcarpus 441 TaxID=765257 RepID=A0A0C9Z7D7_9AGAM|nr:hypothetical protein PISMIDRAFT_355855 [Pisolithus microcarpus 441]
MYREAGHVLTNFHIPVSRRRCQFRDRQSTDQDVQFPHTVRGKLFMKPMGTKVAASMRLDAWTQTFRAEPSRHVALPGDATEEADIAEMHFAWIIYD